MRTSIVGGAYIIDFQGRTMRAAANWQGAEVEIQLLPAHAYRTHEPTTAVSLGFCYERQRGRHSIASDRMSAFDRLPGSYAIVPRGVEMFSESETGGEYLVIRYDGDDDALAVERIVRGSDPLLWPVMRRVRSQLLQAEIDADLLAELALTALDAANGRQRTIGDSATRIVTRALEIMQARICDDGFNVSAMAAGLGLSPVAFLRAFRQVTGTTPSEFIRERRVQLACRLMAGPAAGSLSDVAAACGFAHQSHMGLAFRRVLGMTPLQFLKRPGSD